MLNSLTGQKNNNDHPSLLPLYPWCLTGVSGCSTPHQERKHPRRRMKDGCNFCAKVDVTSLNSSPGRDILDFCFTKRTALR